MDYTKIVIESILEVWGEDVCVDTLLSDVLDSLDMVELAIIISDKTGSETLFEQPDFFSAIIVNDLINIVRLDHARN